MAATQKCSTEAEQENRRVKAELGQIDDSDGPHLDLDEALRMKIIRNLVEMAPYQVHLTLAAIDAIRNDRGTRTPEEEFVSNTLVGYSLRHKGLFAPDKVQEDLDIFKQDMESLAADARQFAKRFPDLMQEPEVA